MSRRWILSGVCIVLIVLLTVLTLTGIDDSFSRASHVVQTNLKESLYPVKTPTPTTPPTGNTLGKDMPKIPANFISEAAPAQTFCKWQFSHYESSHHEQYWFSIINEAQKHICKTVAQQKNALASKEIMERIIAIRNLDKSIKFRTYDSMLPSPRVAADGYMSRMYYSRVCYDAEARTFEPAPGTGVQLIEPLWGMLRDPFDMWCGGQRLVGLKGWVDPEGQSKAHILPQGFAPYFYSTSASADPEAADAQWRTQGIPPWHSTLVPEHHTELGVVYTKPKNVHVDLGSSYFAGWSQHAGNNIAASGRWFYDLYHDRGQKFDKFIAVEVEVLDDNVAYKQLPDDLVGIYSLVNVGLTMGKDDHLNTIDMIKRVVRPEDFFVFKLDIDSAPIEMPIIESLLADDPKNGGASALIDELMFEHHVDYAPMNGPWKTHGEVLNGTLASSYEMFRNLRKKGIRAHSWP